MKLSSVLLLSSLILPAAVERRFEENLGQAGVPATEVQFLARDRGGQVFFTSSEVVWDIAGHAPIRLRFAGAAGKAHWLAEGAQSGVISYVIGADPAKWVNGARQFDRIAWRGVYPGIDAVFYWQAGRLEYDLIVSPGADPSPVRLAWSGAPAHLLADGSISVAGGLVKQRAPQIYQGSSPVDGRFRARAGEFHLALGRYDRRRPLVVDPVLEMATYLGGESDDSITVLSDGLVAGTTASVQFPGSPAVRRRSRDAFVRGTGVLSSGFSQLAGMVVIGGAGDEEVGGAVTLSGSRQVVVAGTTTSDDFPITAGSERVGPGTANGFVCTFQAGNFISTLNSTCQLVGGSGEDRINALSGSNFSYVFAGETTSPDIPNAVGSYAGGKDGFFGHSVISTGIPTLFYLGGPEDDRILSVGSININSFVLGGETRSASFPYLSPDSSGLRGPSDGFIANVTITEFTAGAIPTISSFLVGGSGEDRITAVSTTVLYQQVSLVNSNSVAVAGVTTSPDLPVQLAAQPALAGESDAFAGVWRQGAFDWLTYLGGSGTDEATAIARNAMGDLFVGGWTRSTDLKTVIPLQDRPGGGDDAFYAAVGPGAVRTLTYYGGSGNDRATGLTLIRDGVVRIGGVTSSPDLPQVNPWQPAPDKGTDGFIADIASSFLFSPAQLQLAKDGSIPLPVRAAQNAPGLMVTYRSSDPSKVLLFDGATSAPELTVPFTREVRVEGLADSGEAQILISAPGFASASSNVRLYPGVLITNSLPAVTTTWSQPISLYAAWAPADPDSGRPVPGTVLGFRTNSAEPRSGFRLPPVKWTSSDERVLRVSTTVPNIYESTQLIVGVPGESVIRASAPGLPSWPPDGALIKVAAPPLSGRTSIRLGKDLQTGLGYSIGVTPGFGEVRTGTLTARSADPSRLLLSADSAVPGAESVTVPFSVGNGLPQLGIWAQALADEGQVPVIVSSPELSGEVTTIVELEPSRLRWGWMNFRTQTLDDSQQTTVGAESQLNIRLEGLSGSTSSGPRPGLPDIQLRLSNSADTVVEANRVTIRSFSEAPRLVAIAPGSATLTLTQPDSAPFPLANATVRLDVAPVPASRLFSPPPSSIVVGKDLQTLLTVRYTGGNVPISVVSEDPASLLVSTSLTQPGQRSVALTPAFAGSDYQFAVQALRDSGETGLVITYPGGEYRISVTLVPSSIGLRSTVAFQQGIDQAYDILLYALDERTGTPLSPQSPAPGKKVEVTLRTTGAAARLTRETATLEAGSNVPVTVGVTLPPLGEEAVLIAEAPGSTARQILRRLPRQITVPALADVMQDTVGSVSAQLQGGGNVVLPPFVKATSSDPDSLLLSLDPSQPGRASVQSDSNSLSRNIYLHALKGAGAVTVTFEAEGYASAQTVVSLSPLRYNLFLDGFNVYGDPITVPANTSLQGEVRIQAPAVWRPGAEPVRVALRTSDSAVATVTPATLSLSGSSLSGKFTLAAKSIGQSVLSVESDRLLPFNVVVNVRDIPPAAAPVTDVSIGANTQVETSLVLNQPNPNGAIATITSSDPSRLVVSRNAANLGNASVTLALQPGTAGGSVYFQALASDGEVTVTATTPGFADRRWRVRLSPTWFTPYVQSPLGLGDTRSLSLLLEQSSPVSNGTPRQLRAGLGPLKLPIVATDPAPIELAEPALSLPDSPQALNTSTQLRGAALGSTSLRFDQPPGFGPVPPGRGFTTLRVVPRSMSLTCSSSGFLTLGIDTQVTCNISGAPAGTVIDATSSDPARLLLSQDPLAPGSGRQTFTTGPTPSLTFQALASSGSVETLLTAPGFSDLRVTVALRRTDIRAGLSFSSITRGGATPLTLVLAVSGPASGGIPFNIAARAGSAIRVAVAASPSGIVSLDPASVTFAPGASSATVQVRGVAEGSAVLSLTLPDGFIQSSPAPITVVVR